MAKLPATVLPLLPLLAACQTASPPPPAAQGPALRFAVTDVTDPGHPATLAAESGAVRVGLPFSIVVRAIASDPQGMAALATRTVSVTPFCGAEPVPAAYRAKLIVLPEGVVQEEATPTRLVLRLPLFTQTLVDLGVCPEAQPTRFRIDARAVAADRRRSDARLIVDVGALPAATAAR